MAYVHVRLVGTRYGAHALRRHRPSALLRVFFSTSPPEVPNPPSQTVTADATATKKPSLKEQQPPKSKSKSPMQNLRDVMEALDDMIEEAEKKVVKKYRPNMFAEFKQLNDTGGKVLEGPEELIAVGKAASVPSLKVKNLDGEETDVQTLVTGGKITLMLTSFKNFGLNMLPAWREAFQTEFLTKKNVQVVTVNIIEDWYMKLVQGSIMKGLQAKTPTELHAQTFAHFGRCDDFRTPTDLNNSFVGYAHLVDGKGRIRWIAGGQATPEELARLIKVTKQLLEQSAPHQRR